MKTSVKARAMKIAHIIFKSDLGFTFSRCLVKAYASLKTTTPAAEIRDWLTDCARRANKSLNLSISAYRELCSKINSICIKVVTN